MSVKNNNIKAFNFQPGRIIAGKYEVVSKIGAGWEGEVYKIRERNSKVERAAKLFYPHRNIKNKTATQYARRMHKLRHCPAVVQYHAEEVITVKHTPVTLLISEFVEGEALTDFLKRFPGKRLHPFQAVHLLYALAQGIECIHRHREYHGDLHAANIIVRRHGLSFELKLLDFFLHRSIPRRENMHEDICDMIKLFYDSLGGQRFYSKHPQVVKDICLGLKSTLI
ncbi:MAG: protein kinase, partial [Gammaproteobacteria bacterium]|nr:protein kinase [Gammaproteobacteria bacterium]